MAKRTSARRYDVTMACLLLMLVLLIIPSCGESFPVGVPVTGKIRIPELLQLTAQDDNNGEKSNASSSTSQRRRRRSSSSSSMIDRIDVDSVPDAQALLACRSYLQRRNKLGEWKQRQKPAQLSSKNVDKDMGFFWPDSRQLKYLYKKKSMVVDDDDDEPCDEYTSSDSDSNDDNYAFSDSVNDISFERHYTTHSSADINFDDDDDEVSRDHQRQHPSSQQHLHHDSDEVDHDRYAAPGGDDYQTHRRRSLAAQKVWSNPQFRARWYQRRWGGGDGGDSDSSRSGQRQKQKRRRRPLQQSILEHRLRVFNPDEFLASAALAEMTPEEIRIAIRTYVKANRKRSVSRQKTLQDRKAALMPPKSLSTKRSSRNERLPRDLLLHQDPLQLEQARKRRSELAVKRYQSRLRNAAAAKQEKKTGRGDTGEDTNAKEETTTNATTNGAVAFTTTTSPSPVPSGDASPAAALARIRHGLATASSSFTRDDSSSHSSTWLPDPSDLELILQPARLAQRKPILRQVLWDCFGLRGKCVPPLDVLEVWMLQQQMQENNKDDDEQDSMNDDYLTPTACSDSVECDFCTQVPVDHLGKFVLYRTRLAESYTA